MTVVVSFIYVSHFLRSAHPGRLRRDSESKLMNRFVEKNNKTKPNRITRSMVFFVIVVMVLFSYVPSWCNHIYAAVFASILKGNYNSAEYLVEIKVVSLYRIWFCVG